MRSSIQIIALSMLAWAAIVPTSLAQTRRMGLKMDDAKYLRLPGKSSNIKLKGAMPASYSIREFLPEIADQGQDGTCVGWAAAYYMRTAMEAGKQGMGGQQAKIAATAFSPNWLYGQVKSGLDNGCAEGVFLEDALEVMKTKGTALLSCAPADCNAKFDQCDEQAAGFKIADYATLFNPKDKDATTEQRVNAIKSALVEGKNAVLIGMMVPLSFIEEATENWQAAPGESVDNTAGGHAMAVVGYDDAVNGGSFLIANSWGKTWGSNGYTWAKYGDLVRFTRNAYQIFPEPVAKPQPQAVTLKGNVDFSIGSGAMAVHSTLYKGIQVTPDQPDSKTEMITYSMSQPYPSGTRFKMVISNTKQSYVYILGSDQENRVSALFPYNSGEVVSSAMVPANSTVLMPSANTSFTLDAVKGEDYFVVFISQNELNLDELANKVKNAQGTIVQKAYAALGEEFISPKDIAYDSGKISYEVKGAPKGSVVPILVKIIHQ